MCARATNLHHAGAEHGVLASLVDGTERGEVEQTRGESATRVARRRRRFVGEHEALHGIASLHGACVLLRIGLSLPSMSLSS